MSKDALRCDSLQISLHNLQISLSRCTHISNYELTFTNSLGVQNAKLRAEMMSPLCL